MSQGNKSKQDTFNSQILPIMKKVREDLSIRQADEMRKHGSSLAGIFSGTTGPDGGMASGDASRDAVRYTGDWNSKTVEDYISIVKAELRKRHITVDAVTEQKMIDYLVQQQMPKSCQEYILKEASKGTLFYIQERAKVSSLQDHIDKEANKKYNPSILEEAAGGILSWITNAATTMGAGGFFGQLAVDSVSIGTDKLATGQQENFLAEQRKKGKQEVTAASKKSVNVPKWMYTQMGFGNLEGATAKQLAVAQKWADSNAKIYRQRVKNAIDAGERIVKTSNGNQAISVGDATLRAMQYEAFSKAIRNEKAARSRLARTETSNMKEEHATENVPPAASTGEYSGWNTLWNAIGMNGIGDTMQHMGYTLAMLPDMLLGVFTGKTKSVGLNQSTMMPLAALMSGTFIKNPLLKIPLMLYGGANLVNKMGQEALAEQRDDSLNNQTHYKQYTDEELNKRMKNPQIEGNVLLVDIDNIPRLVTLPDSVVEAYKQGALPVNVIANRVLAKVEQSTQNVQHTMDNVSEKYEQNMQPLNNTITWQKK